jgi:hypothetical protein
VSALPTAPPRVSPDAKYGLATFFAFLFSVLSVAYTELEFWFRGVNTYVLFGAALTGASLIVLFVASRSETTWNFVNLLVALAAVAVALFAVPVVDIVTVYVYSPGSTSTFVPFSRWGLPIPFRGGPTPTPSGPSPTTSPTPIFHFSPPIGQPPTPG